jgi:hypothetical protein
MRVRSVQAAAGLVRDHALEEEKEMIDIYDEIDGSPVVVRERDYSGDYENESVWDYYTLEDGRRCVLRNGFFWEWLEGRASESTARQ